MRKIIPVLLLIIVAAIIFVWFTQPKGSVLKSSPDRLVSITDSGSTNSPGWQLDINYDGSGATQSRTFRRSTFDAIALKQALDSTDLSGYRDSCMRSVSFGSVETLSYNGHKTTGIDCYMNLNPKSRLTSVLNKAIAAAHLR